MKFRNILIVGLSLILLRCKNDSQTNSETFVVDGDTITAQSTEDGSKLDPEYQLADLTPEIKTHINSKLKEAEGLIIKYNGQLPSSKYNCEVLDEVFEVATK